MKVIGTFEQAIAASVENIENEENFQKEEIDI